MDFSVADEGEVLATEEGSIAIDLDYVSDLLRRMVRVDSVLPREEALAELVAAEIAAIGVEPELQLVAVGRPNVLASVQLGPRERFVTFTGHLDTVGPAVESRFWTPISG